jgi:Zn-dependent protease with chaperone function
MLTVPLIPDFKIPFDLVFPALIYLFWRFGTRWIGLSHAQTRSRTLWRLILLPIVGLMIVAVQLPTAANDWRYSLYVGIGPFHTSALGHHLFPDGVTGSGAWPFWLVALFMLIRTAGMAFAIIMGVTEYVAVAHRIRRMPRTVVEEGVELIHTPDWIAFSFGLFRPRIYVSEGVYYSPHRDAVMAHERAHVRRRDPITRFVAHGVERLLWYLPFWSYLTDSFELATECACDAEASRAVGKASYAGALLAFTRQLGPQPGLAVPRFNDGVNSLFARAKLLAGNDDGRTPRLFWPVFTIIYALLIILS